MAGKNHLERSFRMLVDDSGGTARDLSGDLVPGSVQGGGLTYDEVELTGVSDTVKNYLGGHPDSEVSAQFHVNDTAATGAYTVLIARMGTGGTLDLRWGQNGAAPITGDPRWLGEYVLLDCSLGMNGGKAVINAKFKPQAGQAAPAFGTVP